MSAARAKFQLEVGALEEAVSFDAVGVASGLPIEPGVSVLRRGAVITGFIMLESFVRDRTEEILMELRNWPAQYVDLPERFRRRATIEALPHIEKFGKMVRAQGGDYEAEVITEVRRMASMSPPAFQFTKFIAGDYTGNISEDSAEELLRVFQVRRCWESMHSLSADVGFGVPSVREVLKGVIRNRHRSAHAANYSPTASDVLDLPHNVNLIGICIDTALSTSTKAALGDWRTWISDDFDWRSGLEIYLIVPSGAKFRLIKKGAKRALRLLNQVSDAKGALPGKGPRITQLIVEQSLDGRPKTWDIT